MRLIRYIQLCMLIFRALYFGYMPPRKPRGDMRNFARSFFMGYTLMGYIRNEALRERRRKDREEVE